MNFGELKSKMVATSHRKDLSGNVAGFVDDARVLINQRLGLSLVTFAADSDTDVVLTDAPMLYFYGAMAALYEYILEFETATYYLARLNEQFDAYYVTAPNTVPLVITPGGASDEP